MLQALFQVEGHSTEQSRQVFVPRSSQSRGSITKPIKMRQKKKKRGVPGKGNGFEQAQRQTISSIVGKGN